MNDFQNKVPGLHDEKKASEFFKVYGITILLAFAMISFFRSHLEGEITALFEHKSIEVEEVVTANMPIASTDDLLCFDRIKILINNISF